mmetsp:Transcript_19860/g.33364  ORF Transcript_19860/g.33364 Transcript_19860/m.33364 type:complete len:211 (-) Transcript_19860:3370-4002(-)
MHSLRSVRSIKPMAPLSSLAITKLSNRSINLFISPMYRPTVTSEPEHTSAHPQQCPSRFLRRYQSGPNNARTRWLTYWAACGLYALLSSVYYCLASALLSCMHYYLYTSAPHSMHYCPVYTTVLRRPGLTGPHVDIEGSLLAEDVLKVLPLRHVPAAKPGPLPHLLLLHRHRRGGRHFALRPSDHCFGGVFLRCRGQGIGPPPKLVQQSV